MFEKDIAQRKTISAMIQVYKRSLEKVFHAIDVMAEAEKEMKLAFGDKYYDFSPIERFYNPEELKKQVHIKYKKNAWKAIIKLLELEKVMSSKRKKEIDDRFDGGRSYGFEDKDIPELEEAAVYDILRSLAGNAGEFAREMVVEAYDNLMPGQYDYGQRLKTNIKNGKNALGKKVILSGYVSYAFGGGFKVNYDWYEGRLIGIDKTFHALDGKNFDDTTYRGPLVDAINKSEFGSGETEYFKFKAYGNGNLHLEFKRPDLVDRINQIANDGTKLRDGK